MKIKNKIFTIQARVDSLVTVEVAADTIEQALEKAKTFKTKDFLYDMPGDIMDQEHRITGIWE